MLLLNLLVPTNNDLADPVAYAWLHLGYIFRERRKLLQAGQAFLRSRDGWSAQGHKELAIEAIAGLAGTKMETRGA